MWEEPKCVGRVSARLDDDTLAARAQHRAVRLADGGAAERRLLELGEDLAQRHAQLLLDDGCGRREREISEGRG